MDGELILKQTEALQEKTAQGLLKCNDFSASYGLMLTQKQALELSKQRFESLRAAGRVEFGEGVLSKLIYAFCDSPYVQQSDWPETLAQLQEAFYYFKNESGENLADDELIEYMAKLFNGKAQGSMDYLLGTGLEELCRRARGGCTDE